MANPTYRYFAPTGNQVIDAATHGYYWALGADRTVDWSISNGFDGEYWNDPNLVVSYAKRMLETYSYYADIKFNYVGYFDTPSTAASYGSEINISLSGSSYIFPSTSIWARGNFNPSFATNYAGEVGDVYLNLRSAANRLSTYEPGSAGWFVFLHELGHVLGLKHPHDDGGTGRPTLTQLGAQELDIDWASIMSYRDDFNWNLRQWDPATPMFLDVLALQYIYGKNMTTNAGDSNFILSLTNSYTTLWDASGNDTVSASTQWIDWSIDLPSTLGTNFSDTKIGLAGPTAELNSGTPRSLYWLAGDIENAVGGSGHDTISGNDTNNFLAGGAGNDVISGLRGNDTIDGGAGTDTAEYSGSRSSFTLTKTTTGWTVYSATEDFDTLVNIERLDFNDKRFALDLRPTERAGQALEFIGLLAPALVNDPSTVGSILRIFDNGLSLRDVCLLALDTGLVRLVAGSNTNADLAAMGYRNLFGSEGSAAIIDMLVGYMDGRSARISQADFMVALAGLEVNQTHIGLVGLQQTGVEYV